MIKKIFLHRRFAIQVTNGQIGSKKKGLYTIWDAEGEEKGTGIVTIRNEKYYYLGVSEKPYKEFSGAKALTGAAIGTVLAPGVGTLLGGAVGAIKKNKSSFVFAFMSVNTKEVFTVEGVPGPVVGRIDYFKAHPIKKELDKQTNNIAPKSAAEEIREFKALLEDGIITQEEFDNKKKDLLG